MVRDTDGNEGGGFEFSIMNSGVPDDRIMTLTAGVSTVDFVNFYGASLNMNTNEVIGITNLEITSFLSFNGATNTLNITPDAGGLTFNVPTGDTFEFSINATTEMTLSSTLLTMGSGNSIVLSGGTLQTFGSTTSVGGDANGLRLNSPSGTQVRILIDSTFEYDFLATEANFRGNNLLDVPQILDSNGNELLIFTTTASAVNELTLVNAATATPVELQATGGDTDVDVQFTPKGTGTFYGNRETWSWPLTDETTAPTTGVKYTTEPAPYDMSIEDAIAGLTTAGTGAALWTIDVLKEDSVNADTFTTIFSTLPTIDASEFTSTTAATPPVISVSTWEKGRRLQLSISTLDTDGLARGSKISLLTHATAK